jgi:uncharacterized repeat protein (TIGR03803 family)
MNYATRYRSSILRTMIFGVLMLVALLMAARSAQAQTETVLYNFCSQSGCKDGGYPYAGLVQGTNGYLYGTTGGGGAVGGGTVFRISPSGGAPTIHSICRQGTCAGGYYPLYAELVEDTNGSFYGTTIEGGANGVGGAVFKITPGGKLTPLYSFCSQSGCTDGGYPYAGLVLASNGNLYGTTLIGGASDDGTVFEITPSGKLTTLYSFCSQSDCADGESPSAALIQATDGNLYGTTRAGGANTNDYCPNGCGTIFEISPSGGALTTLYSFCSQSDCADGDNPNAALVQDAAGNFYGTTSGGGAMISNAGTVFQMTPNGMLTTLYTFCGALPCTDGEQPEDALIQATDGNLYGTTLNGGAYSGGTIFRISPTGGALTPLYSFCSQSGCADGANPWAQLVQDTNGYLYGTTSEGGTSGYGTVFSLSVGLGPFVKTLPTSGKVKTAVKILGTDLTGATSVTFNGTAAVFKVASSSEITTKVPKGATTGPVQVVTPGGTLTSNMNFQVN